MELSSNVILFLFIVLGGWLWIIHDNVKKLDRRTREMREQMPDRVKERQNYKEAREQYFEDERKRISREKQEYDEMLNNRSDKEIMEDVEKIHQRNLKDKKNK